MQRWSARLATGTLAVAVFATIGSPLALAHVDLAGSTPADGSELIEPVTSIELVFTEAGQPAGDGIRLLVAPDTPVDASVAQSGDSIISITPTEPLTAGTYAVGWTVQAGDAHPRSGSITFTVVGEEVAAPTVPPEAATATPLSSDNPRIVGADTFASLATESSTTAADWLGRLARWLGLLGALVGIGALTFGATVPTRSASEARQAGFWVRRSGLALLISVPLELLAQAALLSDGSLFNGFRIEVFTSVLSGPFGWSLLLRGAGGAGLLWGMGLVTMTTPGPVRGGIAGGRSPTDGAARVSVATRPRYLLDLPASAMAGAGGLAILASYVFDGHTVTASPALIAKLADVVHVGAAAVWVGGVAMLALTLARRRTGGRSLGAAELVIRFSSVATVALAAVGIAGVILAWSILDSVGELLSTAWGQVLLVKLAAVGTVAAVGGYNHFVVLPQLTGGDEQAASELVRRTSSIEIAILVGVVGLTAILVGSAS